MKIGKIDTVKQVFVIAEIGNNHEGSYALAKELIGLAADCGVDAVKFQTIIPEKLITKRDKKRMNQLKKFQLSYCDYEKLAKCAKKKNIIFLSTPFDLESVDFLNSLVPAFKISSGDNNFYPLLHKVALTGKPIIISTGLIDYNELRKSVHYIEDCWSKNKIKCELALLHCVSSYPTKDEDSNLLSIQFLRDNFKYTIGYSDHILGIDACLIAVALGARIIEKHFTIDKNYSDFRDHKFSADPAEMKLLVNKIRNISILLGEYGKKITESEKKIKDNLRRSLAAKRNLCVGHIVRRDDIVWVRPGLGFSIDDERRVIGKQIKEAVSKGELITTGHIK